MNKLQIAEQFRKALQMLATSFSEDMAMEVATIFPAWSDGKTYNAGDYFTYDTNKVGDPQLYRVVQGHTSQAGWIPADTPSLYSPIGLDDSGYPVWSQPTGAHDSYSIGDIVNYNGTLYKSLIDGNVYSPTAYPQGWEIYTED